MGSVGHSIPWMMALLLSVTPIVSTGAALSTGSVVALRSTATATPASTTGQSRCLAVSGQTAGVVLSSPCLMGPQPSVMGLVATTAVASMDTVVLVLSTVPALAVWTTGVE